MTSEGALTGKPRQITAEDLAYCEVFSFFGGSEANFSLVGRDDKLCSVCVDDANAEACNTLEGNSEGFQRRIKPERSLPLLQ